MTVLNLFEQIDRDDFFSNYWQKKPLFIKGAFKNYCFGLSPEELAGLACEEEAQSRIVINHSEQSYDVRHGPFNERHFSTLPVTNWSLLVQEVDHFAPSILKLKEQFRFIPDWRLDDVMISYSTDQGSLGPHIDQYDVFLLQGLGQKRWNIGKECLNNPKLLDHQDLQILEQMHIDQSIVMEEGDLLYLPPKIAHHGIALGDSMTISIGFRSPSYSDLLNSYCQDAIKFWDETFRYKDSQSKAQDHPAEISDQTIEDLHHWLIKQCRKDQIAHWFGRLVTSSIRGKATNQDRPKVFMPLVQIIEQISRDETLYRNESSRLAFSNCIDKVLLFIDGAEFILPKSLESFVKTLASSYSLNKEKLAPFLNDEAAMTFLSSLIKDSVFYFVDLES